MNYTWKSDSYGWRRQQRTPLQQARYDNRNNRLKNKHRGH